MKKIICLFLSLSLMVSISSCGTKENEPTASNMLPPESKTSKEVESVEKLDEVEVEKELFDVKLTIPKDFIDESTTQESLNSEIEGKGYKSATLNDDGSVTYEMTKSQHKEMMDGIKESVEKSLSEMVADQETIVSIEANEDYTDYKVNLSTDTVGIEESFIVMGLYIYSGMYHVFNGTEPGNIHVEYIEEATGNIIEEANSNDVG